MSKTTAFFGGKGKPASWHRKARTLIEGAHLSDRNTSKLNYDAISSLMGNKRPKLKRLKYHTKGKNQQTK